MNGQNQNKFTFKRLIEVIKKPRYCLYLCINIVANRLFEISQYCNFLRDLYLHIPENFISGDLQSVLRLQPPKDRPIHVLVSGPSSDETVKYLDLIPGDVLLSNGWVSPYDFLQKYDVKYIMIVDAILSTERPVDVFYEKWAKSNSVALITRKCLYDAWPFKYKKNMKFINLKYIPNNKYQWDKFGKKIIKYCKKGYMSLDGNGAISAIYSAVQLGYKEIYLHGVDWKFTNVVCNKENKYIVDPSAKKHSKFLDRWINDLKYMDEHPSDDLSLRNKISTSNANLRNHYKNIYHSYEDMYNIEYYASIIGAKIYNMSIDSNCDCFEKLNEEDILKRL